jgi:hypothetical protein
VLFVRLDHNARSAWSSRDGADLKDKLMDMAEVARLIGDAKMQATTEKRAAASALPQSS